MATITQTNDCIGDWNDTSTWIGGVIPADGDAVQLYGGIVTIPATYTTNRILNIDFTSNHETVLRIAGHLVLSGQIILDNNGSSVILDGACEVSSNGADNTTMILVKYQCSFTTENTDSSHIPLLYNESSGLTETLLSIASYNPFVDVSWVDFGTCVSYQIAWGMNQTYCYFNNCAFHDSISGGWSGGVGYSSSGICHFLNCIFYNCSGEYYFRTSGGVKCYNCSFGYLPDGSVSSTIPSRFIRGQFNGDYILSTLYTPYDSASNSYDKYKITHRGLIFQTGRLINIGPGTVSGVYINRTNHILDTYLDTGLSAYVLTMTPNSRVAYYETNYAHFPETDHLAIDPFYALCKPADSVTITINAKISSAMASTSSFLVVDPFDEFGLFEEISLNSLTYTDFAKTITAPSGCTGIPFYIVIKEYASGAILYIASIMTEAGDLKTELNFNNLQLETTVSSSGGGSPQIGSNLIRRTN